VSVSKAAIALKLRFCALQSWKLGYAAALVCPPLDSAIHARRVWLGIGQRVQQHRLHHTEQAHAGADTERRRQDRNHSQTGNAAQGPQGLTQISQHAGKTCKRRAKPACHFPLAGENVTEKVSALSSIGYAQWFDGCATLDSFAAQRLAVQYWEAAVRGDVAGFPQNRQTEPRRRLPIGAGAIPA